MMYFIRALQLMAAVSEWSVTALADGKVTMVELVELGTKICKILGVKTEFEVIPPSA
jgi:DNA-binding Xre family transcriptional regulator